MVSDFETTLTIPCGGGCPPRRKRHEGGKIPPSLFVGHDLFIWKTLQPQHIGEFAGIPVTGKHVKAPLCVVHGAHRFNLRVNERADGQAA